jgi:hypothetical protein
VNSIASSFCGSNLSCLWNIVSLNTGNKSMGLSVLSRLCNVDHGIWLTLTSFFSDSDWTGLSLKLFTGEISSLEANYSAVIFFFSSFPKKPRGLMISWLILWSWEFCGDRISGCFMLLRSIQNPSIIQPPAQWRLLSRYVIQPEYYVRTSISVRANRGPLSRWSLP